MYSYLGVLDKWLLVLQKAIIQGCIKLHLATTCLYFYYLSIYT